MKEVEAQQAEGMKQAAETKKTAAAADKAKLVQDKIAAKNTGNAQKTAAKAA